MEQKRYIFVNGKGRRTVLAPLQDGSWAAFVGKQGGDFRKWKTLERAQKEMELKGWKRI